MAPRQETLCSRKLKNLARTKTSLLHSALLAVGGPNGSEVRQPRDQAQVESQTTTKAPLGPPVLVSDEVEYLFPLGGVARRVLEDRS